MIRLAWLEGATSRPRRPPRPEGDRLGEAVLADRAGQLSRAVMICISIGLAALEAIAATIALGSVGYEREESSEGERQIWLARRSSPPAACMWARRELFGCHPEARGRRALIAASRFVA